MLSTKEIIQFLKNNKSFIKEKYHCSEIGLFGSFARNEQNEKSDIDILVEYEKGIVNLYEIDYQLKTYLKQQFGREIDICSKKWINPIFKPLVLNETVYV